MALHEVQTGFVVFQLGCPWHCMKLFWQSIRGTDICNHLRPYVLRESNLTLQGGLWLTSFVQHNLLATLLHKQRPLATMSVVLIDSRHSRGIDPKPGLVGTGYVELALGSACRTQSMHAGSARDFVQAPLYEMVLLLLWLWICGQFFGHTSL